MVAHFHYTVFGTVVFLMFAAYYFWWPKWTGRKLNESIGKWQFWTLFIGFQVTFLCQHWLGVQGMPRRYGDYLAVGRLRDAEPHLDPRVRHRGDLDALFIYNVMWTWRKAPMVGVDDPWGYGASLEWATSCPPPRHNFTSLPNIRSERPAFDLHHPEYALNALPAPPEPVAAAVGSGDSPAAGNTEGDKQ